MTITKNRITIELEEDEIQTFNDIILFALDYDSKENVMTEWERTMAKKLADISEKKKDNHIIIT